MQSKEHLITPALGVVIILSTFILGVPLVYRALLGLLGLAAVGTYFTPHAVQVETRIAIAALGLIILLIVTSTAFWLALLSFAAIAALQIPHRGTLQRSLATIAWLETVLRAARTRRAGHGAAGEETEAATLAGDGESRPQAPSAVGTLPEFVRVNVAGIGGLVVGALVLVSVFMPWYGFLVSAYGEMAGGESLTLRAAAEELDLSALSTFFYILLVLGMLSIISMVLPRAAAAVVAAAGFVVVFVSYLYVVAQIESEAAELSSIGASVTAIPAIGALLAGACCLVMLVLQLIPGANRSR